MCWQLDSHGYMRRRRRVDGENETEHESRKPHSENHQNRSAKLPASRLASKDKNGSVIITPLVSAASRGERLTALSPSP